MAGNRQGGLKAAAKNKAKDPDYYKKTGAQSWKNPNRSRVTGFAANRELARIAGSIGGKKTKNEYAQKKNTDEANRVQAVCACGNPDHVKEDQYYEDAKTLIGIIKEIDTGSL